MRKIFFASLVLVFTVGASVLHAQQTPKKASAPKVAPKKAAKPGVVKKKKITKKAGEVFIWDGSYFYHSNSKCPDLIKSNKGNRKIFSVPIYQAKGQFSAKACRTCRP